MKNTEGILLSIWLLSVVETNARICKCDHTQDPVRDPNRYTIISDVMKTWTDAREYCLEIGADLVSIETEAENVYLAEQIEQQHGNVPFWVGFNDLQQEGFWSWIGLGDETLFNTIPWWGNGEPNNAGNEDCAEIRIQDSPPWLRVNDNRCSNSIGFICERCRRCHIHYLQEHGRRLNGYVIESVVATSILHCTRLCGRYANCHSINFSNGSDFNCEINSSDYGRGPIDNMVDSHSTHVLEAPWLR